mmetsp:Transcript_33295/g.64848  ORF Transcript_33295/g.64848 Transcript_33295/m.64848 type:complete len:118 (-) Transcript_33295:271-624(-)
MGFCCFDYYCIRFVLAIFLPPLAVCMTVGCGMTVVLNVLLTLLGFIPGIIHAMWIVCKANNESKDKNEDAMEQAEENAKRYDDARNEKLEAAQQEAAKQEAAQHQMNAIEVEATPVV